MNHSIAKKKLSKKYLFYSIKIQPQKFAQNETALRETAVAEGHLYLNTIILVLKYQNLGPDRLELIIFDITE